MNKTRIIFMGTPDFAVASLRALVEAGCNVVAVVTMPDKPVGKHQSTLRMSPVKLYAISAGLPVLQPEKLKDEVFIESLRALEADMQIVVAFRMLPEAVWSMPPLGTFNVHASLLPQYRGAAPINWAVINGETETGVTTFFLAAQIDTGRIIMRQAVAVDESDDAGTVHDRLMELGAKMAVETAKLIVEGRADAIEQEKFDIADGQLRLAPKIFNHTCRINWEESAKKVNDFIRGLSPYPSAWTELVGEDGSRTVMKICRARKVIAEHTLPVGTVVTDFHTCMDVAVWDGFICLIEIQIAGKKRMGFADYLNGLKRREKMKVE